MTDWSRARQRVTPKATNPQGFASVTGDVVHGVPTPTIVYSDRSSGSVTETTNDMEVANWKVKIENGEMVNNPFERFRTDKTYFPPVPMDYRWSDRTPALRVYCSEHGTYHDKLSAVVGQWAQYPISFLDIDPVVGTAMRNNVRNLAVTQAHANIGTEEMLAMATLAEGRKSVDSVASILKRANKILRNVKKLNLRALRKEFKLKELEDRYMEARYAIRPLVYDSLHIINALKKERRYERKVFRGYAEDSALVEDLIVGTSAPVQDDWQRKTQLIISARAGVLCDVDITNLGIYGIDQPAETLWELVPFSFIADWFANTGDWIAARTPNIGVTQRASWVTIKETLIKTQEVVDTRWNLNEYQTPVKLQRAQAFHKVEESVLSREISTTLSTFPSARMRLDSYKLTDLGIILRRIF